MIYAQWSGTEGFGQQSSTKGYLKAPSDGHNISVDEAATHSLYPVVVTEPSLGADQVKDAPIWGFDSTEISLTWSVRAMTQDEIDSRTAGPILSIEGYYILKNLFDAGVITTTDVNNFSQVMQDAYAARNRLET